MYVFVVLTDAVTTRRSDLMDRTGVSGLCPGVTPAELRHAIAVDMNGMLVFPARPVKVTRTPLLPTGGVIEPVCKRCGNRYPYGHFDYAGVARQAAVCWHCRVIQDTEPLPKERLFTPRSLVYCLPARELYHYCVACGRYCPVSQMSKSRRRSLVHMRALCRRCHTAAYTTSLFRPFAQCRRNPHYSYFGDTCRFCKTASEGPVCEACRFGLTPIPMNDRHPALQYLRASRSTNLSDVLYRMCMKRERDGGFVRTKRRLHRTICWREEILRIQKLQSRVPRPTDRAQDETAGMAEGDS